MSSLWRIFSRWASSGPQLSCLLRSAAASELYSPSSRAAFCILAGVMATNRRPLILLKCISLLKPSSSNSSSTWLMCPSLLLFGLLAIAARAALMASAAFSVPPSTRGAPAGNLDPASGMKFCAPGTCLITYPPNSAALAHRFLRRLFVMSANALSSHRSPSSGLWSTNMNSRSALSPYVKYLVFSSA